ncbi:MAG: leucine-rich repeat domain-containing protein [Muribaculaceae bacterium]|nr:leucine-rich repeat domain-containing protein [Muribaculaceae bacterium]
MKKFFLLLAVVLLALPSLARDFEYNGLTYTVLDEDARTCETKPGEEGIPGNQVEGDLVIPATVYDGESEYSVTIIGWWSFCNCSELTSVEIPSSVTIIAEGAFCYCSGLTSVEIPSSVTIIGGRVFEHCYNMASVELPSSLTFIGERAFGGCTGLTSVYYGAEILAEGSEGIFETWNDVNIYEQATLYVRESALPQAETVTPWCLFANREAYNFGTGVTNIAADAAVEVYTLDGMKVGASTDELPTGIYIVRQGSEVRKIAVK